MVRNEVGPFSGSSDTYYRETIYLNIRVTINWGFHYWHKITFVLKYCGNEKCGFQEKTIGEKMWNVEVCRIAGGQRHHTSDG